MSEFAEKVYKEYMKRSALCIDEAIDFTLEKVRELIDSAIDPNDITDCGRAYNHAFKFIKDRLK